MVNFKNEIFLKRFEEKFWNSVCDHDVSEKVKEAIESVQGIKKTQQRLVAFNCPEPRFPERHVNATTAFCG